MTRITHHRYGKIKIYHLFFSMHKKILVVYYSFEGSTRLMAETIAHELKADVLELKPVKDLQSKGFMKYVR